MILVPAAIVIAAISGIPSSEPVDYKTAYYRAQEDGRPLLVLVTAEWCPPCQRMKQTTIPEMVRNDQFRDFHFATVDLDRSPTDARNIIGSRGVPQLVLFERKDGQWQTRFLSGYHSVAAVESFLGPPHPLRTADAPVLVSDK